MLALYRCHLEHKMKKTTPTTASEVLPPAVALEYEIATGVLPHFIDSELGEVDLTQLTLEFAERVAARGYLKKLRQPGE